MVLFFILWKQMDQKQSTTDKNDNIAVKAATEAIKNATAAIEVATSAIQVAAAHDGNGTLNGTLNATSAGQVAAAGNVAATDSKLGVAAIYLSMNSCISFTSVRAYLLSHHYECTISMLSYCIDDSPVHVGHFTKMNCTEKEMNTHFGEALKLIPNEHQCGRVKSWVALKKKNEKAK
jgi:hypothetical protein